MKLCYLFFWIILLFVSSGFPTQTQIMVHPFPVILDIPSNPLDESPDQIQHKIKECFDRLKGNTIGRILLARLGELLQGKPIYIQHNKHSLFMLPRPSTPNKLIIELNYNHLSPMLISTIGPRQKMRNKKMCYQIGQMREPFYVVLGHELIHLLHFLELGRKKYLRRLGSVGIAGKSMLVRGRPLYTTDGIPRRIDVWSKEEERKTVLGDPGLHHNQITENNILKHNIKEHRLKSGMRTYHALSLRPRYPYHDAEDHFYESADIIETFYPPGTLNSRHAPSWAFNKERALESRKSKESGCVSERQEGHLDHRSAAFKRRSGGISFDFAG